MWMPRWQQQKQGVTQIKTPHMPRMAFFFLRSQQLVDALEEQQSVGGLYDRQTFSATSTAEYNEREAEISSCPQLKI